MKVSLACQHVLPLNIKLWILILNLYLGSGIFFDSSQSRVALFKRTWFFFRPGHITVRPPVSGLYDPAPTITLGPLFPPSRWGLEVVLEFTWIDVKLKSGRWDFMNFFNLLQRTGNFFVVALSWSVLLPCGISIPRVAVRTLWSFKIFLILALGLG